MANRKNQIIALLGATGGCGKTTVTTNLSAELSQKDLNVLVIDLDSDRKEKPIGCPHYSKITSVNLPSSQADQVSQQLPITHQQESLGFNRVDYLKYSDLVSYRSTASLITKLKKSASAYDVVLLDCPSIFSEITEHAVAAATHYIAIIDAESGYSPRNLIALGKKVCNIAVNDNLNLKYLGTLINKTRWDSLHDAIIHQIITQYNTADLHSTPISTFIPVQIRNTCAFEMDLRITRIDTATGSVSSDYTNLANHLVNRLSI
ncbi:MAG: ParA family protein [Methylobacter sp.]|uniref:ParA family protein n=1 Tax=Methylobacter sp. TaxID=2051955 RepID=UPI00258A715F|nr:ParA family protein [Methylobacter sp.]MCL7421774.1 ParA family protein [Methylobacter sp.]